MKRRPIDAMHELEMPKTKQWLVLDRFDRAVLAAAVILFYQLIVPPIIGLADTASFLFLLVAAGLAALMISERGENGWTVLGFVIAAVLFISSKLQEVAQAPLLALVVLRASMAAEAHFSRERGIALALSLIIFGGWYYVQTPPLIRKPCLYKVVFYELLPNSPTPGADLEALGASGELMKYSGTTAFVENSPINQPWFQEAFFDKVGHRHVLQFYLLHPQRFWGLIKKSALSAFILGDCCLGNFEKRTGLPPNSQSASFGLWSGFRQHALPGSVWVDAADFLLREFRRRRIPLRAAPSFAEGAPGDRSLRCTHCHDAWRVLHLHSRRQLGGYYAPSLRLSYHDGPVPTEQYCLAGRGGQSLHQQPKRAV